MTNLLLRCQHSKLYVDHSAIPNAGLGVFTKKDIHLGQEIEVCVAFPFHNYQVIKELEAYQLYWTDTQDAFSTGFAMMYNHSYFPNVEFVNNHENNTIRIVSLIEIRAGEELLKQYRCKPWW